MENIRQFPMRKYNFPNFIKINRYNKKVNAIFKETASINNNYILNIKLSSQMKIIIEIYSEENPTNLYFKSILTINELKNMHSIFKYYISINDIYESINDIISKGKYEIKFENYSNENIYLFLYINNEQIKIKLKKEKISFEQNDLELNDFINQFYHEFLNLKAVLNAQIKEKNEEIKSLKEENKIIKMKLEKIEKENIDLKDKVSQNITLKYSNDNLTKKNSNHEQGNKNLINRLNQEKPQENKQNNHKLNPQVNNIQNYKSCFPPYYKNDGFNNCPYFCNNNNINNINKNEIKDKTDEKPYEEEIDKYEGWIYENICNIISNDEDENFSNIINNNNYSPFNFNFPNFKNINLNNCFPNNFETNINNNPFESLNSQNIYYFNKKFNTQYKNNQIKKLDLGSKNLGNDIFKEIIKYDFQNLIKIYLCNNNISNIDDLNLWDKPNLQKLYLSFNQIKDISILSQVNFGILQILYLDNNKISDINVLAKVNFPLLSTLSLHDNQIKDISVFAIVNFKDLNTLSLYNNMIVNIDVFKIVKFPKLKILELNGNNISDINCLENIKHFQLLQLYLDGNENIDKEKFSLLISGLKNKVKNFKI